MKIKCYICDKEYEQEEMGLIKLEQYAPYEGFTADVCVKCFFNIKIVLSTLRACKEKGL